MTKVAREPTRLWIYAPAIDIHFALLRRTQSDDEVIAPCLDVTTSEPRDLELLAKVPEPLYVMRR
jgi:hypothetical protein